VAEGDAPTLCAAPAHVNWQRVPDSAFLGYSGGGRGANGERSELGEMVGSWEGPDPAHGRQGRRREEAWGRCVAESIPWDSESPRQCRWLGFDTRSDKSWGFLF